MKRPKRVVDWIIAALVIIGLFLFVLPFLLTPIYLFVMSPVQIVGQSMNPSFKHGEYYMINKIGVTPQRGDVIVYKRETQNGAKVISRIVGVPQDRLKIENGKVYLNGNLLSEPYLVPGTETQFPSNKKWEFFDDSGENSEFVIPDNNYFVMGDNRAHSEDSRSIGLINKDLIVGKVSFRYWPLK